jgi:TetR/AcrR family transcriptional regulator, regulator of cefoperazone and chloramphenicol sensitivity
VVNVFIQSRTRSMSSTTDSPPCGALEILIATRSGRADGDQQHLLQLFSTLTRLGRYVADGLEPERADAVGNLVWTTLMGAMVAKMAVPGPVDVSRELHALTDVIAAYVDRHRAT